MQNIFTAAYSSVIFGTKRYKAELDYPTMSETELVSVMRLLAASRRSDRATFEGWFKMMQDAGRQLHESSWAMEQIIGAMTNRFLLATTKTDGVWESIREPEHSTNGAQGSGQAIVCDPGTYDHEERKKIEEHCERLFRVAVARREPTDLELRIMKEWPRA